jgi:hypothetical protein
MFEKMLRVALPAALALTLIGAGPAHADTKVYATGNCSAASTWALGLQQSSGVIELTFKVQTAVPGEIWHVRVRHGRHAIFRALKITKDDGAFHLRLLTRDWTGADPYHVRAVDTATQEICFARGVV